LSDFVQVDCHQATIHHDPSWHQGHLKVSHGFLELNLLRDENFLLEFKLDQVSIFGIDLFIGLESQIHMTGFISAVGRENLIAI